MKFVTNEMTDMKGIHLYLDGDKHTTFVLHPWEYEYAERLVKEVAESEEDVARSFAVNDLGYWLYLSVYKYKGELLCSGSVMKHWGSMSGHPSFHDSERGNLTGYRQLHIETKDFDFEYENRIEEHQGIV